jgi:putative oxidoreductase
MTLSPTSKNLALLVIRIIIGGIFIYTGWMKIADMTSTVGYFASMGIPAFLAYIVGYAEFIGGILLVIGLWNCLASAVLAIIMIVAAILVALNAPQMVSTPLAVLAALLGLIVSGPGSWAIGKKKNTVSPM